MTNGRRSAFLAGVLALGGCEATVRQKPPEEFHENESGFVEDEDGKGSHWEAREVKGARGGWDIKLD